MTTTKINNEKQVKQLFIRGLFVIMLVVFLPNLYNLVFRKIVQGKVVAINRVPSVFGSNITSSYPVVLFKTDNGWYKFAAEQNLNLEEGQQVRVIYNPGKPEDAKVFSFAGFWLGYIIALLSGFFIWYALVASFPNRTILKMFKIKR